MVEALGDTDSTSRSLLTLKAAAQNVDQVVGLTHRHYKYPARFSPQFVSAAIEEFSSPGDLVLDPHVGGGTTLIEAMARGRVAVGGDVNTLATFVTRVKSTFLSEAELNDVEDWAVNAAQTISYRNRSELDPDESRTYNLQIPRARAIKKYLSLSLDSLTLLGTRGSQELARCVLLSAGQWAFNGRKRAVGLSEFRAKVRLIAFDMIASTRAFSKVVRDLPAHVRKPTVIHDAAQNIATHFPFSEGIKADLVVTSPPYPGVHILYHRWQVDGRKETPAPYWIANCLDGHGSKYYNYGGRSNSGLEDYFETSLRSMIGIRAAMKDGGTIVQMLAFSEPESQLGRYLDNMKLAGFSEIGLSGSTRIWRDVPGRNWHANSKGKLTASKEVVLVHVAS
ncbi:MAG: hypothetical protein EOP84_11615 [Verrucomicrobiaceae bacterium]|nr:MAG: hypothetical protein EOP84_11615 [Verrucomicrobiaceae bacterium]